MTIWHLPTDNDRPKYIALADHIATLIQENKLKAGEKLPPQRRLADTLEVTTGTITRAYAEAEKRGIVSSRVGSGTYVSQKEKKYSSYWSSYFPEEGAVDFSNSFAPIGPQESVLHEALQSLSSQPDYLHKLLHYTPERGYPHQREKFSTWLKEENLPSEQENCFFTQSGQHGLFTALQAMTTAGDTVICEALTFPGLKMACDSLSLKCVGLRFDEQGICIEALEAACKQYHPKVIYLMPQSNNPTTAQIPLERRKQIIEVCRRHRIFILEDDVQVLPKKYKLPAMVSLAPEITFHISSFSKRLSGGIRLGFAIVPNAYRTQFQLALRANQWTISSLPVELFTYWCESGCMTTQDKWLETLMDERWTVAKDILKNHEIQYQPGGFNLWIHLPESWSALRVEQVARQHGLILRAGDHYLVGGNAFGYHGIRLCISQPKTTEQMAEGLRQLVTILEQESFAPEQIL
ncbi:aminotransferase-like domain-containing protein [Algicola sagamiensis]|uniref:aminotransferase-like domain-containing protein n=1 Tax=Algicola sagamiensis TaxID=163869 RepID=UPI0003A8DF5F|nr:PLP-dependent aminotransferase family protein [Algicola sagamiensis]